MFEHVQWEILHRILTIIYFHKCYFREITPLTQSSRRIMNIHTFGNECIRAIHREMWFIQDLSGHYRLHYCHPRYQWELQSNWGTREVLTTLSSQVYRKVENHTPEDLCVSAKLPSYSSKDELPIDLARLKKIWYGGSILFIYISINVDSNVANKYLIVS